jgi:serine/threonine protein kinase
MTSLTKGTIVGGYVIEQVLKPGGFACAYFASKVNDNSGKQFFLKELFCSDFVYRVGTHVELIKPEYESHWETVQKGFEKEYGVLLSLTHAPSIPTVKAGLAANNTFYIVQDKVSGVTFDQYYRSEVKNAGAQKNQKLLLILLRLLMALGGLHKFHKLHRDLKPSNILVDQSGNPHLIDFGAAKVEIDSVTKNISGQAYTVGFASFEQSSQSNNKSIQGAPSDLYSLAATFYFLMFNEKPPAADERVIKNIPARDFMELKDSFHADLLASLNKAFNPLPKARFASTDDWIKALKPLAESQNIILHNLNVKTEYSFEVGRKASNNAAMHRVLVGNYPKISGNHLLVNVEITEKNEIICELTDTSTNGTSVLYPSATGMAKEILVSGEPVSFEYDPAVEVELADVSITLADILRQYAEETQSSQISKTLELIEDETDTKILQAHEQHLTQDEPAISVGNKPKADTATSTNRMKHALFSFSGTIPRSQFWKAIGVFILVQIGLTLTLGILFGLVIAAGGESLLENDVFLLVGGAFAGLIMIGLFVVVIWAYLATYYKRLMDTGMSKALVILLLILSLIPFVNVLSGICSLIICGCVSTNTFSGNKND